ncbi:MAG: DUF5110 domain-containing protein [Gammaproteobacteria bacterium]|nr:DUF5110 domain-containing protein [Gammaproteobacteria bacterium]
MKRLSHVISCALQPLQLFQRACLLLLLLASQLYADAGQYVSHQLDGATLSITTSTGELTLSAQGEKAFAVHFLPRGKQPFPSFALHGEAAGTNVKRKVKLKDKRNQLQLGNGELTALIHKNPLTIEYLHRGKPLLAEAAGVFQGETADGEAVSGFRFKLDKDEKLLGGGERVLGMDRRGYRLPLYNEPHGEYSTHSEKMNYGLPAVMSSDKYILLFDNSAKGWLDAGKTESDILSFEAVGGRLAYLVVAGDTYPELIANYVAVTGRQPMPPRWSLGYIASRFGYRSEQEARDTLAKFEQQEFPVDAIIFDLYWFGKDIQGHMGNLQWDREAFPEPEKMMADFASKGIKTILITEPFILTSSGKWDEAVANKALATDAEGKPFSFSEFYFGTTGIVDIFDPQAADWFWSIYRGLMEQGASGWWCDLAEPEKHPAEAMHVLGSADEVHNAYGHEWAKVLFENQLRDFPGQRPFILIRSGFAGSQRYGIFPWTGDVKRGWGGLKPQVELSLQMGLLGLAYTHSDLGGFVGDRLDEEAYVRWLQYGVFQPIYRPHGIEPVAPEPVFHSEKVRDILRQYVQLRYRMTPYNYTLAHINSTTGMPLMRPLFFSDEDNLALMDNARSYFWGDAFFVSPITDPSVSQARFYLPDGVWFDFWNDQRYSGGRKITRDVDLSTLPVLVKAGAFVPMVQQTVNAASYSSAQLTLHYYHDASVRRASGQMYEDDGETYQAYEQGKYELLEFSASSGGNGLTIELQRQQGEAGYEGMPDARRMHLVLHNIEAEAEVEMGGTSVNPVGTVDALDTQPSASYYDPVARLLTIAFDWDHKPLQLQIGK